MSLFEDIRACTARIAQQYHHQRRAAHARGEPFDISHREWLDIWRNHHSPLEPGRMARPDTSKPWSRINCMFQLCPKERPEPPRYPDLRVLTVGEWVRDQKPHT